MDDLLGAFTGCVQPQVGGSPPRQICYLTVK
jgi:hypothetical protein